MTTAIIILSVLLLFVTLLMLAACARIETVQAEVRAVDKTDHTECVDRLLWRVQGEFAAIVLRDAAAKWESVENRHTLERMRNTWKPGDEGVASQWMLAQAEDWRNRGALYDG